MRFYLIVFLFLFSLGCEKAEDRQCMKTAGEESERLVIPPTFNKLKITEHIKVVLVQDTVEKIVLRGGKNLLNFIDIQLVEGVLVFTNTNTCNFLRSYKKKVTAEIHFKSLINLHFEGTEQLSNVGKLNLDWFTLLIRDGAGPVNLTLDAQLIDATIAHGWGDFTLKGTVNRGVFDIRSNGYCDTYGLNILDSLTVVSKTQGQIKVNSDNAKLKAQIETNGNILYRGTPTAIELNRIGNGQLIDDN
jgi:hypothetical protein